MGPTKSFKTGAVVGTYPKPMLVALFDEGGLDVIISKSQSQPPGDIPFDIRSEDVITVKPNRLSEFVLAAKNGTPMPKVLALDFCDTMNKEISLDNFKPRANSQPMQEFVNTTNYLYRLGQDTPDVFPWKTVVLDNLTGLSDIILSHISAFQSQSMNDARVWASMVGAKVVQTIGAFTSLPCHVVILMHTQLDKNELTQQVIELPKIYSGVRDTIGALFSNFFYATKENGRPVIYTTDRGFVRGIGPRWPAGLPPVCQPDFQSIYGKELK